VFFQGEIPLLEHEELLAKQKEKTRMVVWLRQA